MEVDGLPSYPSNSSFLNTRLRFRFSMPEVQIAMVVVISSRREAMGSMVNRQPTDKPTVVGTRPNPPTGKARISKRECTRSKDMSLVDSRR